MTREEALLVILNLIFLWIYIIWMGRKFKRIEYLEHSLEYLFNKVEYLMDADYAERGPSVSRSPSPSPSLSPSPSPSPSPEIPEEYLITRTLVSDPNICAYCHWPFGDKKATTCPHCGAPRRR